MIEFSNEGIGLAEGDILRRVFDNMRSPHDLTPSPGFYGRVLRRIEKIEYQSIWVPLIYSQFPVRVATAFLGIALAVLGYVVAAEQNVDDTPRIVSGAGSDVIVSPKDVQQQRDAVLTQIVTYRKP